MKMKRLVWGFFTIAAVALLAGCGGGGGTSLMVGGERATQSAIDELETSLSTANDNVTRLTGELDTANDNLATANGDLTAANMEVTRLTGELATANGNVAALTGELDTANDNLTAANMEVTRLTGELATANGDVAALMGERDSYKNRAMGFETAQNARDDATGAAEAAAAALDTATTNSVLITTRAAGVAGDSAIATANARSVLDAKEAVDAAVVAAQGAVDEVDALAPDADADTTDALTRALNAAIAVANTQLAAAQAVADDPLLAAAVAAVTGAEDNPMTPEDRGRIVAEDITAALEPTAADDGSRARGTHATASGDAPDATVFPDAVMKNDAVGMTWAEIVTEAGKVLVSLPVTATGGGTELVDAASFAGMAADDATDGTAPTGPVAYGTEYTGASYMGIAGRSFCAGSDCSVDDDSNLTGSWYFTPTEVDEEYVGTTTTDAMMVTTTTYAVETLYAQFGHWLTDTDSDGNTEVNTYAYTGGNTANVDLATDTFMDVTATYSGEAAGMSSTWTTDEDNVITSMASGAFTATVDLTATFDDTSPSLTGTIYDFVGPAVDSTWSVDLASKVLDASNANFSDGATSTGPQAQSGVWTAQGYGADSARPTGFFGGFNAHFTDGHAAGAYAARAKE